MSKVTFAMIALFMMGLASVSQATPLSPLTALAQKARGINSFPDVGASTNPRENTALLARALNPKARIFRVVGKLNGDQVYQWLTGHNAKLGYAENVASAINSDYALANAVNETLNSKDFWHLLENTEAQQCYTVISSDGKELFGISFDPLRE